MTTKQLYRVHVTDSDGDTLEVTEPTEFYTGAHLDSFNWDSDYPEKCAFVERSLDGGQTWSYYDASEYINGAPAWVHHQNKWRSQK